MSSLQHHQREQRSVSEGPQKIEMHARPGRRNKKQYAKNEDKIDEITGEAWDSIFVGKTDDPQSMVEKFFEKYDDHIFTGLEFVVKPLDPKDIGSVCFKGLDSSGGFDGLTRKELSLLPDTAFVWLARWFDCIEGGAP